MKNDVSRRGFLGWLISGIIFLGAALASSSAAMVRFFFPNVLYEPDKRFKAEKPNDYMTGPNFIEDKGIFIFKQPDGIFCVSSVCTHLGCTVQWKAENENFFCPCHGSIFSKDGQVKKGPAPRALEWYEVTLSKDGRLVVDQNKIVGSDYRLKV